MGCCLSIKTLDHDRIHSAIVLQTKGESSRYHGTTARGRFQTLGDAELVLTQDGIFSQVIGTSCCKDRGFLHIPLFAITNIHDKTLGFNGLYRIDRPHLIITYIVPGKGEYQAGWQMNQTSYEQWRAAIENLLEHKRMIQFN
ncbi:unnamed protein product [Rotaria sp. Silwood1]|nr:unnamed protein product [Rotaria sp. Silwood1]CAF3394163.1 unnamed protein product [Rotaria sp. Silwood1]CAF3405313.1 unnamed protein product [Rotaria sp. Silwood1]CAF3411634.1 unnamed protein product [Rotaria sp. Silwood1]CAF3418584.1 unnamed protein product [Rotaria sp. Silwood1]